MNGAHLTVIAGPTASGKTSLAIKLARETNGEIVSADSQQVYRHFDIGTAQPSAEELAAVPHHLISVVDPLEPFSAARFQTLADAAIAEIASRGKRVIVVGGTGLYLRILLHGVVDAPPANPRLRAELEAQAEREGRVALHARLAEVDPPSAARIPPNDLVRIVRALEIHTLTGTPASTWRQEHGFSTDRYPFTLWVLTPERDTLYRAIDERTAQMFSRGLIDEARSLVERGYRDAPPMGSVGYHEALLALEGKVSVDEAIRLAAQATRRYAKRQLTWFRKEPSARLVTPPYAEVS
jgi:tRNA dimethylallyltransferase